jgi:long-chain acyl-CoA synthetase
MNLSGIRIYPEEIEARINNLNYVMESVVVEKDHKLYALVYPDYESVDKNGISEQGLKDIMEDHRKHLNKELPAYMNLSGIRIYPEEFEKTPKKSIKRFLYSLDE